MLLWTSDSRVGMSLLKLLDLPLDALAKLSGMNPWSTDNFYDPDNGYDGWELHGTFNGEAFQLYTRWGCLRVGGFDGLDVDGLIATLTAAIAQDVAA